MVLGLPKTIHPLSILYHMGRGDGENQMLQCHTWLGNNPFCLCTCWQVFFIDPHLVVDFCP